MRQIVNFSENLLYSVIPAGASGQIMSQFYDNQTRLYLNGEYVKIEMRLESLKNKKTTKILKIVPQE